MNTAPKLPMTQQEIEQWIDRCNHEPARQVLRDYLRLALAPPSGEGVDSERIAQLIAHRVCCGTEHDPANGKLHGYCVVCGVEWPCEYAGKPPTTPQSAPVDGELEWKLNNVMWQMFEYGKTNNTVSAQYAMQHVANLRTTPPPASQERGRLQVFHCREAGDGDAVACKHEPLLAAAKNLRAAQRAYMADRGNESLGRAVGERARELDDVIALAEQAKPDEVKYTECTRDCDCVGYCKAGLEKPVSIQQMFDAEQAQAGESREARMVVVERDNDGKPTVWCDPEIVDLVTALNAAGIRTVASCSGHGEQHGNIALVDGRELLIAPSFEAAREMDDRFAGGVTVDYPMVHLALNAQPYLDKNDAMRIWQLFKDGVDSETAMRAALVAALGADRG